MEQGIQLLIGKVLTEVNKSDDRVEFKTDAGEKFIMYHNQDCCESVSVDEIDGDLNDLLNSPVLEADERTNSEERYGREYLDDSWLWTFYTIRTVKATVTIKWLGTSNGYYSESVSFEKMP